MCSTVHTGPDVSRRTTVWDDGVPDDEALRNARTRDSACARKPHRGHWWHTGALPGPPRVRRCDDGRGGPRRVTADGDAMLLGAARHKGETLLPAGSGTTFQWPPNRVDTNATPDNLSTVEPTAMQNPWTGQEMLASWPTPFGMLETVQLRPPSSERIAVPVMLAPTVLPPTAMQRRAVGHVRADGCALAVPNRVLAHSVPPSAVRAAIEASGTVIAWPPTATQIRGDAQLTAARVTGNALGMDEPATCWVCAVAGIANRTIRVALAAQMSQSRPRVRVWTIRMLGTWRAEGRVPPNAGCGLHLERRPTGSLSRHDAWPYDQHRPNRRSCGSPVWRPAARHHRPGDEARRDRAALPLLPATRRRADGSPETHDVPYQLSIQG